MQIKESEDYSQKGHYYIEDPRREVLELIKLLPSSTSVLDIGAGFGNNSKAFLARGLRVTALEPNKKATNSLEELNNSFPGLMTVIPKSLGKFRPQESFDAVTCCMVLHFLDSRKSAIKAINDIKSWTNPGGLNLITSYVDTNTLDNEYSFLLHHNELRDMYADWELVWYEESYARNLKNSKSLKDLTRLLRGQKGYKAARILARKPTAQL